MPLVMQNTWPIHSLFASSPEYITVFRITSINNIKWCMMLSAIMPKDSKLTYLTENWTEKTSIRTMLSHASARKTLMLANVTARYTCTEGESNYKV